MKEAPPSQPAPEVGLGAAAPREAAVSWIARRWKALSPAARLGLAGGAGSLLAAGALVWLLHSRPEWRPLMSELSARQASQVVDRLEELKVPYRLADSGGTVLVPTSRLYEARLELAGAGLPEQGQGGFELFDRINLHSSDFAERVNYQRALQGELSATVAALPEVESARVHLTLPRRSLFLDEVQEPSAAVLLKLRPGERLGARALRGITHLVAASVEGMKPAAVTVMDTSGALLFSGGEERNDPLGEEEARELQRAAQELLTRVLGPGKALVEVRIERTRERRSLHKELYEPTGEAGVEQERTHRAETYRGVLPGRKLATPSGESPAGQGAAGASGERPSYSLVEDQVRYAVGRRTESTEQFPGKIRRLTAAVLIDSATGRQPAELQALEKAVKMTLGFDAGRGDQFHLQMVAFNREFLQQQEEEMAAAEESRRQEKERARRLQLRLMGGAAGGALLLALVGLSRLRRRRPSPLPPPAPEPAPASLPEERRPVEITVPAEEPAYEAPELGELLEHCRELVRVEPQAAARVIEAWLGSGNGRRS